MKNNTSASNASSYRMAQNAIADLKASIYEILNAYPDGLTNAQIGRSLGIYSGHIGHEGHISRTLLGIMESEGVVEQSSDKKWALRQHCQDEAEIKASASS